jgi:hypothetical protein
MKTKTLALLLLISLTAFSQKKITPKKTTTEPSKEETQQWIKEKINSYSFTDETMKYNYKISFEGNDIIVEDGVWLKIIGNANCYRKNTITDIDYISFRENESNFWFILNLKNGTKAPTICDNETITTSDQTVFILDKSFKNGDLPQRMTRAFKRLIELYGGKKTTKKEAF